MYHRVDVVGRQSPISQHGQPVHGVFHHIGQEGPHHIEGQEENQAHDGNEQRDGQVAIGEYPVDFHTAPVLLTFGGLFHAAGAHAVDEIVPHIRQGGVPVQTGVCLHFDDGVLDELFLVLAQLEEVKEIRFSLDELGGGEPAGNPGPLGVVLDDVAHRVDAPVHRSVGAEVLHFGEHLVLGGGEEDVHQLGNALVLHGADGHHGNAQGLAHFLYIDASAVAGELVHHVQGDHRGNLQGQ